MNYYNENDPYPAEWLRNLISEGLIPKGDVDERSIVEVKGKDLEGYAQCHFFAGIGGWPYALELAGWPADEPVWTGSCPCQPFSAAGKRLGEEDERHLWPAWLPLIAECKPPVVFGEQVASKDGRVWLSMVRSEMEALGYAIGSADICAAGLGAHHARQRLWFVSCMSNSNGGGWQREWSNQKGRPWREQQFERLVQDSLQSSVPAGRYGALSDGVSKRTFKLRAYGNAIVPQVAAEFVMAFMECKP